MATEFHNPPELYKHPAYSRIMKVTKPSTLIFLAGCVPADDKYLPLPPGDLRAQYLTILDSLTLTLKAAGATWDDVTFRRMYAVDVGEFMTVIMDPNLPIPWSRETPSPSTLIGVTRLSNPGFLIEVEIMAVLSD